MGNRPNVKSQGEKIIKEVNLLFEITTVEIGEVEIELLKIIEECGHCLEALQLGKKAEQIQLEKGRLRKKR